MSTFSHGAFQILAHRIVNPPNWHLKHSIIAIINIIITITVTQGRFELPCDGIFLNCSVGPLLRLL